MKKLTGCVASLCLGLLANQASAEDRYYAGLSVGLSSLDIDTAGVKFDDSDFGAFKLYGGVRVSKSLALEAAYFDLGTFEDTVNSTPFNLDINGWQLYSVLYYPYSEKLTLDAKAGVVFWMADISAPSLSIGDEDDTDFAIGFGTTFASSERFAWRGEFEWLDIALTDAWLVSVGAQISF